MAIINSLNQTKLFPINLRVVKGNPAENKTMALVKKWNGITTLQNLMKLSNEGKAEFTPNKNPKQKHHVLDTPRIHFIMKTTQLYGDTEVHFKLTS